MDNPRLGSTTPIPTPYSATLQRLSSKTNVRAALVIQRSLGSVIESAGSFSWFHGGTSVDAGENYSSNSVAPNSSAASSSKSSKRDEQGVDELAAMVLTYVKVTEGFAHSIDSEDDPKLLQLQTRKHKVVIVPDPKYIFVVVTDTSSA